jgi:rfaE bifunctional protein nucleotidyltransferase chain/domain
MVMVITASKGKMVENNQTINFLHNGAQGDIIYSLPTVIAFGGGDFYFEKHNQFKNLLSLLELQPYLNSVALYDKTAKIDVNLSVYRKEDLVNKHLCRCHLDPFQKEYDLSKSWITNIEPKHMADIIICRTRRYHDKKEIDWSILKKYEDKLLFIGDEKDRKLLHQEYGVNAKGYWCKDGLEFAQIIKGSKIYIGNQSLGFALAEAMKHPRILEVYYGKNNCQPNSDNGYTYLNEDLIDSHLKDKKMISKKTKHSGLSEIKTIIKQDIYNVNSYRDGDIDFIIDIGANIGVFSVMMRMRHPNARIIAIEPNPESYEYLLSNTNALNIETVQKAFGNGKELFFFDRDGTIISNIYLHDIEQKDQRGRIESLTLKNIFETFNLDMSQNYILKFDCEGAEKYLVEDSDSEEIIKNSLQTCLEIHFNSGFASFDFFEEYNTYNDWINKKLSNSHFIRYYKSRRSKGYGHYCLVNKNKLKPENRSFFSFGYKAKQGQDKWIVDTLDWKTNGYFVDIGAYDGVDESNSYILEKDFNWNGICIEPNIHTFSEMKKQRKCICENICISDVNGTVEFIERDKKHKMISGIHAEFSDDAVIDGIKDGVPVVSRTSMRLYDLLKKHNSPNVIDYLSIDTEGSEYEILKNFPFDKYIFKRITIEHNACNGQKEEKKKKKIFELLTQNGYKRVEEMQFEDWYVYSNSLKVIHFDDLQHISKKYKSINKKIVSTNGVFDLLHPGHLRFLSECKENGDILVVGLNTDSSVKRIKGDNKPILNQQERIEMLSHVDIVDYICLFDEETPCKMLAELKTDVHCKDSSYSIDEIVEKPTVEENGGKIELIKNHYGYSTTNIIKRVKNKLKIGVIIIATGRYLELIQDPRFDIINSLNKHFFTEDIVNIYLFTDGDPPDNVKHIYQEQMPWPYPTLLRFRSFYNSRDIYKDNDYMFYIDADSRIVSDVGKEIISDFTVVQHWSLRRYKNKKRFPFETNIQSTSAITDPNYSEYYSGAFFGAKTDKFISMSKNLSDNVDKDLENNIIAVWHDESHLNKYCYDNPPELVLDSRYQARINHVHELEDTDLLKQRDYKITGLNLVDKKHYRIKEK